MRNKTVVLLSVLMVLNLGCEQQSQYQKYNFPSAPLSKTCLFTPAKIKINPLTEFTQTWQITAYIDVLDQFNSRIKAASIWRFELYEYVPRSTDSKGSRIYIWQDINLADAGANNSLWQDYLRCYRFVLDLDMELAGGKTYILQAECFTSEGRRLIDSIELKL